MAFDTIGNNLIVADAYYGIWLVDLKTGKKQQLISPNDELDGKVCLIIGIAGFFFTDFIYIFLNIFSRHDKQPFSIPLLLVKMVTFIGLIHLLILNCTMESIQCLLIHRVDYSVIIV